VDRVARVGEGDVLGVREVDAHAFGDPRVSSILGACDQQHRDVQGG
jgi:hypothetical protein